MATAALFVIGRVCVCKVVRLLSLVHVHKWRLCNVFGALDRNEDGLVELIEFDRLFALYNANVSIAASPLLQNEAEGLLLDQEIKQLEKVIVLADSHPYN